MFTLKQIEEIAAKLALLAVKDSQFEGMEYPFNGSESVPVLQDGANRRISFAELRSLVLQQDDAMSVIACSLSVTCNTPGAVVKIGGQTRNQYTGHYGEVVSVEISATGYDTYFESVTLTENQTLSIRLNKAPQELIGVTLTSNGTYYTLTVGNTSVDFYSKSQVDALLAGQGSGEAIPGDTTEAFLNFSKNMLTISAEGTPDTSTSIMSNIPWKITVGEVPNKEADEQTEGAGTGTAENLSTQNLRLVVGQTYQVQEK